MILQIIKFGIVGIIATFVDVGVLVLLKELLHIDVLVSSAISFCVSVAVNYILSMTFVFKSKNQDKIKELIIFVLLSIGGLCLNQLILWIGVKFTPVYYLVLKLFALVIVPVYNFITRKVFLESKKNESEKAMNNVFKKDLYRYYGEGGEPFLKKVFRPLELKYIYWFRKANKCSFLPLKLFYRFMLMCISHKTQIQIPARTSIGEGLYIGHLGRVIIHPDAKLGKNINIATGVTIGTENRGIRKGVPEISDNCWIGANAVVVGRIKIGSDVLIAPLTYVNFDVPDHSIVIGNPGKIIPRENATEKYICNCV